MSSKWAFSCMLGLRQDFCDHYKMDENSRGFAMGYGGCVSCHNRIPANSETETAEYEFRLTGAPRNGPSERR